MLATGKKAPAFSLKDQDNKSCTLNDLKGKWAVIYFYPRDDTPGCTTQACEFTAGIKQFQGLETPVLGCSPDDPESHRKFIAKHGLSIRLLSDPGHKVMESYGAWGAKNMYGKVVEGVIRSTVILDPEGRVAHHWKKVQAAGHADKVRQKLAELQSQNPQKL